MAVKAIDPGTQTQRYLYLDHKLGWTSFFMDEMSFLYLGASNGRSSSVSREPPFLCILQHWLAPANSSSRAFAQAAGWHIDQHPEAGVGLHIQEEQQLDN